MHMQLRTLPCPVITLFSIYRSFQGLLTFLSLVLFFVEILYIPYKRTMGVLGETAFQYAVYWVYGYIDNEAFLNLDHEILYHGYGCLGDLLEVNVKPDSESSPPPHLCRLGDICELSKLRHLEQPQNNCLPKNPYSHLQCLCVGVTFYSGVVVMSVIAHGLV